MFKNHEHFCASSFPVTTLIPSDLSSSVSNAEINRSCNEYKDNSSMKCVQKLHLGQANKFVPLPHPTLSYVSRMNTKTTNTSNNEVHVVPNETPFQPLVSGDVPLMPGLPQEIKKIIGGWDYYVALTHTGTVFQGRWDWNTQHFTFAEQLVTAVKDIGTIKGNIFYAVTDHHEIYLWEQYWDEMHHTNIFSPVTKVHMLKEVEKFLPGNHLALTHRGEIYLWEWDKHLHRPTSAILLKNVKGIPLSGITKILPGEINFALLNYGKVCTWRWDNHHPTPARFLKDASGSVIQHVTEVGTFTDYSIFYILTKLGEVYMWEVYRKYPTYTYTISSVIKIENLTGVIQLFSGKGKPILAMTRTGNMYIWNWNGNAHHPTSVTLLKRGFKSYHPDFKESNFKGTHIAPYSSAPQNDLLLSTDTP